jgi:hypothetical protein
MCKFEKAHSKTFFHKFTERFANKGFNNPWKPAINRILKTSKMILCNSRQASLVATRFKEFFFKTTGELSDDRADPKTTRCV